MITIYANKDAKKGKLYKTFNSKERGRGERGSGKKFKEKSELLLRKDETNDQQFGKCCGST